MPALAIVSLAGCFDSANTNQLSCTKDNFCPDGYVCVGVQLGTPGKCQKGDGGVVDVAVITDSAGTIDMSRDLNSSVSLDGQTLWLDGPSPVGDLAVPDQTPSLDTSTGQDVAAEGAASPDLFPMPDTVDSPQVLPDLAADKGPNVGPDLAPDTPPDFGPDVTPDLGPDVAPDLGPDTKALGAACTKDSECGDDFCVSGVCCNRACTGVCEECTVASHGACTYKSGTECAAATSCTNAAGCSGSSGSCPAATPKAAETPCGTMTCAGSTQSGPTCNGSGACGASPNKECYPFACVAGSGCKTSCSTNADCVSDSSSFCGKNGACSIDSKCWHVTDGSSTLLWQVNPKEPSDPDNSYSPQYHNYSSPGSTPDDVCKALDLCGFTDWKVPTISELRALVRGCPSIVTGGTCSVIDTCLGTACNSGCTMCDNNAGPGSGCYWPDGMNGPCSMYWSSSVYFDSDRQSYRYRYIDFTNGNLWSCDPSDSGYVRCVHHSQ